MKIFILLPCLLVMVSSGYVGQSDRNRSTRSTTNVEETYSTEYNFQEIIYSLDPYLCRIEQAIITLGINFWFFQTFYAIFPMPLITLFATLMIDYLWREYTLESWVAPHITHQWQQECIREGTTIRTMEKAMETISELINN